MALRHSLLLSLALLCGCGDELRLNHMQTRGTMRSYWATPEHAAELGAVFEFTHRPIAEQPAAGHIRQFDFELSWVPHDGNFMVSRGNDNDNVISQCRDLGSCLEPLAEWSSRNRAHHALVILLRPNLIDNLHEEGALHHLEVIIRQSFDRWQIITPGEVSAGYPNLREAIIDRGWPAIELTRGRTMFVLYDSDRTREAYLSGHNLDPDQPRLLFTLASGSDDPHSRVVSFPTVTAGKQEIMSLRVRQGFLVHAITNTPEAVEIAIENGAHFLSTLYPDRLLPRGRIPGWPTACNPVTTADNCEPTMIEDL
jgi:hypothetical protein